MCEIDGAGRGTWKKRETEPS